MPLIITIRKIKGFNLIELMMGIFIFVTCVLAIYCIFPMTLNAVVQGQNKLTAIGIAKDKIEYLKTIPWKKLVTNDPMVLANNRTTLVSYRNGRTISTTFTVSPPIITALNADASLKQVKVEVQWPVKSPFSYQSYGKVEISTIMVETE